MIRINIKPLSVNTAWQGKRFKSPAYKKYETAMLLMMPKMSLPPKPYEIHFNFGFSNVMSDLDNPVKPLMDLMQKKYGFNDKDVLKLVVEKIKVAKGDDYLEYNVETYKNLLK